MGSTTPNLALPYPVGTDRVMDGDNAIQALAVALDGTPWVNVAAFTNGWTNFGGAYQVCRYRKQAGELWIEGLIKPGTVSVAAFTLPAGFRTANTNILPVATANGPGYVTLDSAGGVAPTFTAGAPWVGLMIRIGLI